MCGVVSITYGRDNPGLGREAAALVKHLEYRGYDSTGVATVRADGRVTLRKRVGAPSRVVEELDVEHLEGQKAVGQVRWATYGSVTDANAQPHEVRCRVHVVGAHNGNISNTDALKEFLREHRHAVVSDNDGEMLVHVVEHHLAAEGGGEGRSPEERVAAVVRAIRLANRTVVGSYAACLAVPGVEGVFAIKAGSSLYAGKGTDAAGDFVVVSSDLTSVPSKTRFLIPLSEGEGLHFTHETYRVFSLTRDESVTPPLRRSKLNVADISLQPKYQFFMEQEIAQTASNLDPLLRSYFPAPAEQGTFAVLERHQEEARSLVFELLKLSSVFGREDLRLALGRLLADERLSRIADECPASAGAGAFLSDEAQLFHELLGFGEEHRERLLLLDRIVVWKKKRRVLHFKGELLRLLREAPRVFLVGSGTSYHACLTGAVFFSQLASLGTHPCNPGLFRSVYLDGLRPGDLVLGVTQSGETKDLVDVFNDVRERHGRSVRLVSLVNNENSTIPQEKSDFFLPILCGPEIAVAATKSFVSQIALFYLLAGSLRLDEATVERRLLSVRDLVRDTLAITEEDVAEVALRLFLRPSLHILGTSLIGLAREGALKVREVVLNHTEGYDAAEFKHGPNTILGKNTVFSLRDLEAVLSDCAEVAKELVGPGSPLGEGRAEGAPAVLDLLRDFRFQEFRGELLAAARGSGLSPEGASALYDRLRGRLDLERYFSNYPLLFVCAPDERDVRITISQIHTHKIRGADVILVAEDDDGLRRAVEGRPDRGGEYYARYLRVPKTGDRSLFVFQAAVVLQSLALRMSIAKMKYLNKAHVENHGVHPDVPKNVSKSITVD